MAVRVMMAACMGVSLVALRPQAIMLTRFTKGNMHQHHETMQRLHQAQVGKLQTLHLLQRRLNSPKTTACSLRMRKIPALQVRIKHPRCARSRSSRQGLHQLTTLRVSRMLSMLRHLHIRFHIPARRQRLLHHQRSIAWLPLAADRGRLQLRRLPMLPCTPPCQLTCRKRSSSSSSRCCSLRSSLACKRSLVSSLGSAVRRRCRCRSIAA